MHTNGSQGKRNGVSVRRGHGFPFRMMDVLTRDKGKHGRHSKRTRCHWPVSFKMIIFMLRKLFPNGKKKLNEFCLELHSYLVIELRWGLGLAKSGP